MSKTIIENITFPENNYKELIDNKYSILIKNLTEEIENLKADQKQELKRAKQKLEAQEIRLLEKKIKNVKGNWLAVDNVKLKFFTKYVIRRNYGNGTVDKPCVAVWRNNYWEVQHGKDIETICKTTFPNATIDVFVAE